jgi:hypothetical protein
MNKVEGESFIGEDETPVCIVKGVGCAEDVDRNEYIFCSDFLLIQYR